MYYLSRQNSVNKKYPESLNSSIAPPSIPLNLSRNPSSEGFKISTQIGLEKQRVSSQKKLTLTCQVQAGGLSRAEEALRRQKRDQGKGKFASLRNSQVYQQNAQIQQRHTRQVLTIDALEPIRRQMYERVEGLKNEYNRVVQEQAKHIRELEGQMTRLSQQIFKRGKTIEELSLKGQQLQAQLKQREFKSQPHILRRVGDIQKKLGVLITVLEEVQGGLDDKLGEIGLKLTQCLGGKVQNLRRTLQEFIVSGLERISILEIEKESSKSAKQSTIGSCCDSLGAEISNEQSFSFAEDCFFYPMEESQSIRLIMEVARNRGGPVRMWWDMAGHVRYEGTNSFLYNRNGEKVRVSKSEWQWLLIEGQIAL